ncbi:hypothetical protein BDR26DRAFT_820809 [Obelidium mucronatum]|nr:hypothetical protein BDR26DRAFT_820809 [Obelidium mucronatum]
MSEHKINGSIILLTGGAGFIGSHVVTQIVYQFPDCQVYTMDKLDYCSSASNLRSLNDCPNHHFIKGDVTSADFVNYIIAQHNIDTIIHFAAQSHVDNSFGDSFEFTRNNVFGTHVLLEAARQNGIKRFIHVSTDEVYGEVAAGGPHCNEEAILAPTNPYAATKAAAENLVMAYFKSFKLPVIITRSNNIYGPHQYPEKIIPKFICSLLNGKKCYIHGNGSNSRHYLYASDVASAMIVVLQKGVTGEIYNIGSDVEVSNLQLARYLLLQLKMEGIALPVATKKNVSADSGQIPLSVLGDVVGVGSSLNGEERYLAFVNDRPFNDKRYAIDSSKMHALGWKPLVSFEEGIRLTIDWYRTHWNTWWEEDIVATSLVPHPDKVILRRGSLIC